MKSESELAKYARKSDFKNATSKFATKAAWASLKLEADKLDIGNLEKLPAGLTSVQFGNISTMFFWAWEY